MHSVIIKERLQESIKLKQSLLEDEKFLEKVSELADEIISCISNGGKLVLCGNE